MKQKLVFKDATGKVWNDLEAEAWVPGAKIGLPEAIMGFMLVTLMEDDNPTEAAAIIGDTSDRHEKLKRILDLGGIKRILPLLQKIRDGGLLTKEDLEGQKLLRAVEYGVPVFDRSESGKNHEG